VEKISNCIKTDIGVSLEWMDGMRKTSEHFTFPELESARIPVQELIAEPMLFRIDLQEHKVYRSQVGRGSY